MGRRITKTTKTAMGNIVDDKWIPGTTKKGTADLDCIINSKPVKLEVKIGRDRQSNDQKKQEDKVKRAGGLYYLVHTITEFYEIYDRIVNPNYFK